MTSARGGDGARRMTISTQTVVLLCAIATVVVVALILMRMYHVVSSGCDDILGCG